MISNMKWIQPLASAMAVALLIGAVSTPAHAGRFGGPISTEDVVLRNSTDVYRWVFRGGERATVDIRGDHDSDLDLFIYDDNNNLICSADSLRDVERCRFTPLYTGQFRVEVRNLGVANLYRIWTN